MELSADYAPSRNGLEPSVPTLSNKPSAERGMSSCLRILRRWSNPSINQVDDPLPFGWHDPKV